MNKDIDTLYTAVLASAFGNPSLEDTDRGRMKLVLDTVVCAQEPLTVGALSGLLQLGSEDWVHASLQPLWSVIHISSVNSLVTTLHTSFPDYMFEKKRSEGHVCSAETHHGRLAERCFERIKKNRRQFNICGLESSYVFDSQVSDLAERVERAIPLDLMYACRYWAVHLILGDQSTQRIEILDDFLSKRLLLWMVLKYNR